MASKARWIAIAVAVFGSAAVLWAQPAINLFNQRLVLDANGSLIVKAAAYAGSPGPATVAANTRVKTDASNNLIVAIGAGTATPDVMCLDGTNQDVCLHRSASGVLLLDNAASGGTSFTGIQFGGTSSSFPRLQRNGTGMQVVLADNSANAPVTASTFFASTQYAINGNTLIHATAPTVSSGFGTSPSIVNNSGTAAFTVNVGTGGVATSGVLGLPTATTGWNCFVIDRTNNTVTRETATTTTSATLTAAAAWAASDILQVSCFAY